MAWVNDPTNELLLHGVDLSGVEGTTQYWIADTETDPEGGAAAAISDAVQDLSANAIYLVEILRRATWDASVTPTDGPYPRAADQVILEFSAQDASITKMSVPGPNETILDSGTINVDPADSALAAFVTYVLANCVSSEGAALVALKKGYRRRPSRRKHQ
jgi:hypothetical protein